MYTASPGASTIYTHTPPSKLSEFALFASEFTLPTSEFTLPTSEFALFAGESTLPTSESTLSTSEFTLSVHPAPAESAAQRALHE
eukprot:6528338-Pyramimonas_sp.AAC.1